MSRPSVPIFYYWPLYPDAQSGGGEPNTGTPKLSASASASCRAYPCNGGAAPIAMPREPTSPALGEEAQHKWREGGSDEPHDEPWYVKAAVCSSMAHLEGGARAAPRTGHMSGATTEASARSVS